MNFTENLQDFQSFKIYEILKLPRHFKFYLKYESKANLYLVL